MNKALQTAAALFLLAASATAAEAPRYVGRVRDDSGRARIEYRGKSYLVREGDEIPGWARQVGERRGGGGAARAVGGGEAGPRGGGPSGARHAGRAPPQGVAQRRPR